jgi:MerR family transcriptional regulator, thiopeptide resistance regulator
MWTVSQLARHCSLSRSTLLYYESIGLLKPASRSAGNYRRYGEQELHYLEQICLYRNAGLKLSDIRSIVSRSGGDAEQILRRRLVELNGEIQTLRTHQRAILRLIQNKNAFRKVKVMTKDRWVAIMKASGFSEADMHRWHIEFEKSAPEDHQQFLEFLHIPQDEVRSIREWSRKAHA